MIKGLPYWRLSGFYLFYFALTGVLVPYLGLYLSAIGFDEQAIGWIVGVMLATKVIAPNFWSWLCHRTGKRLAIIVGGNFAALFFFSLLFLTIQLSTKPVASQWFWLILFVTFLYSFFWNAVLAQFEVITLDYLGNHHYRYSQIRVWGSIGFILVVLMLGSVFDHSVDYFLPIAWCLFLCIALVSLSLKEPVSSVQRMQQVTKPTKLNQTFILCFFFAVFLLQLSFGAYYGFFSLYLEAYHYSVTTIACLWAVGVLAEVVLLLMMHKLLQRWTVIQLFLCSLLLTAVRWFCLALFADQLWLLIIVQCIHALSFGVSHAVCIEMIRRLFCHNPGQGQALYSAVGFGAGGAIGAIVSGFLWAINPQLLFVVSGFSVLLAMGLMLLAINIKSYKTLTAY